MTKIYPVWQFEQNLENSNEDVRNLGGEEIRTILIFPYKKIM